MGTEFDTGKLRSIKGYLEQIKGFYEVAQPVLTERFVVF